MSFIVVIEKNGQQQLHNVSLSPSKSLLIGRAWHNDVILNDEYIDASHLQLSMNEDGSIMVSDMGSLNGSRLVKRTFVGESPYTPGLPIMIGDSLVTLYDTNDAVSPTKKLDSVHIASRIFGSFSWVLAATLAAAAGLIISVYYASSVEATSEVLTDQFLGLSIMATVWCLLASFVGKLFRHKTHLKLHWVLVCFATFLFAVGGQLVDVLRFNLDSDVSEAVLVNGFYAAAILLFAYATFSLSTQLGVAKKLIGASVFAVMPVVFNLVTPLLVEEHVRWTRAAAVERLNLPPSLFVGTTITLQGHIQNSESLFAELNEMVEAEKLDSGSLENLNDDIDSDVQISGMD